MRSLIRALLLLGGLCVLLPALGSLHAADVDPQALVGKPAPEIAAGAVVLNGKPMKLSDYKGKVVLIDFWAVWCGPCIKGIPALREWQDEYRDKGFVVLGVTELEGKYGGWDKEKNFPIRQRGASKEMEEAMLKGFAEYHRINYTISALTTKDYEKLYATYNPEAIPMQVVINRKGEVSMVKVGTSEAIKKALKAEIDKLMAEKAGDK